MDTKPGKNKQISRVSKNIKRNYISPKVGGKTSDQKKYKKIGRGQQKEIKFGDEWYLIINVDLRNNSVFLTQRRQKQVIKTFKRKKIIQGVQWRAEIAKI